MVRYVVHRNVLLRHVFKKYCQKLGLDEGTVGFLCEERIEGHYTPADYDMEDGDIIDAFIEQAGD